MRITRVYTRKGDDGTTGLVGNRRVPKDSPRISAYGSVDELNSAVGMARALLEQDSSDLPEHSRDHVLNQLADLQNFLFTVGSELATPMEDRWDGMPVVEKKDVDALEKTMDALNDDIPPLEDFVLPTGTPSSSALHLARTICRRSEREVLTLSREEQVGDQVIPYLNRLSDYLFVLSRWLCIHSGREETTWNH